MENALSPSQKALNLPEIFSLEIFGYLEDDLPSLAAVVLVNKTWFQWGVSVLWKTPPCEKLANITEKRRQIYASHIRSLRFRHCQDSYHPLFKDLIFSKLDHVSISSSRSPDIQQYLQPALEKLEICGAHLSNPAVLDHLKTTCRHMRMIDIGPVGRHLTPASFVDFLKGCPTLERIWFVTYVYNFITDEMLLHLAERDNLKYPSPGNIIDKRTIDYVSTNISVQPFKDIETLDISVRLPAMLSLLEMLIVTPLTELYIEVYCRDNDHNHALEQMSCLTNSRVLEVSLSFIGAHILLSRNEIMSLKRLVHLESLRVLFKNNVVKAPDFTDDDFEELFSHLPHLRNPELQIRFHISAAALASISTHCPLLGDCQLKARFDLMSFLHLGISRGVPIFPRLKVLGIGEVLEWYPVDNSESSIVKLLKMHLLKLKSLRFLLILDDNRFSVQVIKAWEEIYGTGVVPSLLGLLI